MKKTPKYLAYWRAYEETDDGVEATINFVNSQKSIGEATRDLAHWKLCDAGWGHPCDYWLVPL